MTKWLRVDKPDELSGLYELRRKAVRMDEQERAYCPCCGSQLWITLDIIQWGMFEDKYVTFFVCPPCGQAFVHSRTLAAYSLTEETDHAQGR